VDYALAQVFPSVLQDSIGVVDVQRSISLDHISGLLSVKIELVKTIVWPLKYPESFLRMGITPPKGIGIYFQSLSIRTQGYCTLTQHNTCIFPGLIIIYAFCLLHHINTSKGYFFSCDLSYYRNSIVWSAGMWENDFSSCIGCVPSNKLSLRLLRRVILVCCGRKRENCVTLISSSENGFTLCSLH